MDKTKIQYFDYDNNVTGEQDVSYWNAGNDTPPCICVYKEFSDGSFWQIMLPFDVVSKMVAEYERKLLGIQDEV